MGVMSAVASLIGISVMSSIGAQIHVQKPLPRLVAPVEPHHEESQDLKELRMAFEMKMNYHTHEKIKNKLDENDGDVAEQRQNSFKNVINDPLFMAWQDLKEKEEEDDDVFQEEFTKYTAAKLLYERELLHRSAQAPKAAGYAAVAVAALAFYLMFAGQKRWACFLLFLAGVGLPGYLVLLNQSDEIFDWSDMGMLNSCAIAVQTMLCWLSMGSQGKKGKKA